MNKLEAESEKQLKKLGLRCKASSKELPACLSARVELLPACNGTTRNGVVGVTLLWLYREPTVVHSSCKFLVCGWEIAVANNNDFQWAGYRAQTTVIGQSGNGN